MKVWGPAPGEEQGVGATSRLKFPLAGEEKQDGAVCAVCVSALCVYRGSCKGTVFLSVFDLRGHLSLCVCLSVCVGKHYHQLDLGTWNCSNLVSVRLGEEDSPWVLRVA